MNFFGSPTTNVTHESSVESEDKSCPTSSRPVTASRVRRPSATPGSAAAARAHLSSSLTRPQTARHAHHPWRSTAMAAPATARLPPEGLVPGQRAAVPGARRAARARSGPVAEAFILVRYSGGPAVLRSAAGRSAACKCSHSPVRSARSQVPRVQVHPPRAAVAVAVAVRVAGRERAADLEA
jgi:hypothetical protein